MIRELGQSRSRKCASCGAGGFGFSYCTDCQEVLCHKCVEEHGCALEGEDMELPGMEEPLMGPDEMEGGDISGEELGLPLGEAIEPDEVEEFAAHWAPVGDEGDEGDEWTSAPRKPRAKPEGPPPPISQHKYFEEYAVFRDELEDLLHSQGFKDFELFGAGGAGEELSPSEYKGALRVVGPAKPWLRDRFVTTVKQFALNKGFKAIDDRPPSVTHLFGQPVRGMKQYKTPGIRTDLDPSHIRGQRKEPSIIAGRPFLYIYKSYSFEMPMRHELEAGAEAGLMQHEIPTRGYRMYEDRISQIAGEITNDPTIFDDMSLGEYIAREMGKASEFKLLREEMRDASKHKLDLQRAMHIPMRINDLGMMIHLLAESRDGDTYIDLIAPVSSSTIKEALPILSDMMLR
jgi:hypothetical protein